MGGVIVSEPLLRPRDVAKLLSIGESTVYQLASKGILPGFTIPGTHALRFSAQRIEVLLQRWVRDGFTPQRRKYPKVRAKRRARGMERETPEAQPGEETPPAMEGKSEAKNTTLGSATQPR